MQFKEDLLDRKSRNATKATQFTIIASLCYKTTQLHKVKSLASSVIVKERWEKQKSCKTCNCILNNTDSYLFWLEKNHISSLTS